jgi:carboxymethylenebutenolidase
VTCYGRLTTDAALLAPLRASVLGMFAGKDEGISAETIEQFRTAMRKANKKVADIHIYQDCRHGFLDAAPDPPPTPVEREAAEDAWSRIENYLQGELQR